MTLSVALKARCARVPLLLVEGEEDMRVHRPGSWTLAAVLTVSLAGCGGGGDELTKAQFVEQGNGICERTQRRITEAADRRFTAEGEIPSAEQIEQFANEAVEPALEDQLDRLRELTPPQDDQERVEDILNAGQAGLEEIRRDPTSLIGDRDPLENYQELAGGYGLDQCGVLGEEVERALAGLGPAGPVRGGGAGGTGEQQPTGQAGGPGGTEETDTGEPRHDMSGSGGEPADPTETTADTTDTAG